MTDTRPQPEDYFSDWKQREALAEAMIPLVGKLYRERNVVCYVYGKSLVNQSVIQIMKSHRFVRQVEHNELSEFDSHPVIEALAGLDLGQSHIDVGRIAAAYEASDKSLDLAAFVATQVEGAIKSKDAPVAAPRDVVLYGFGRIGRLLARLLIEKPGSGEVMRWRAIVVRSGKAKNDLVKRASLLRRDSIHGGFNGTIRVDEERQVLICNGVEVQVIYANSPSDVNYNHYGIDNAVVIDNTGVWRDEAGLGQHLKCKGVDKVILTAPGKGDLKNIVYGINHDDIQESDKIVTAASCTTNAIVPTLKAMMDKFGVSSGHVETVHAFTNDQNLIDNYHSAERRGRSAPLNMVLTETGAAKAVS